MEVMLSQDVKQIIPDCKIGVIQYNRIEVGPSPQMLRGRLQLFQESIFFDLESGQVTDLAGVKEWRSLFKQIGTDPNRYRPSVEALYRRIQKQNYLSTIHSAADLNNFFSLKYEVPIGIYDADKIQGNVEVRIGSAENEYIGINGRPINMKNKLLTSDSAGAFGSPYVDSERTMVTSETKNALQIIYLRPSLSTDENGKLVKSLMEMFVQIHGGKADYQVVV